MLHRIHNCILLHYLRFFMKSFRVTNRRICQISYLSLISETKGIILWNSYFCKCISSWWNCYYCSHKSSRDFIFFFIYEDKPGNLFWESLLKYKKNIFHKHLDQGSSITLLWSFMFRDSCLELLLFGRLRGLLISHTPLEK